LDAFDLDVNMALYRTLDPVVGRWWSVDPKGEYLTGLSPYNAMNNSPVVYNDPDGDIVPLVWAAIAVGGAAFNVYQNRDQIFQGGQVNWGKLGAAAAIGAGAAVVGTLAAPATAVGGTLVATVSSFAVSGAIGGAVGGGIQGFGNGAVFGTSDDWVNDAISGGFRGAVVGGLVGGALGGAFGVGAHWFSRAYGGGNMVKDPSFADDVDSGVTLDEPVQLNGGKSPFDNFSVQKQFRHIKGHKMYDGASYFESIDDARKVAEAIKDGQGQFLGNTPGKSRFPVYRVNGVTGYNHNVGAGFLSQKTNVFIVKGTSNFSIVPYNPNF
ncbi:hypothetical protein QWY85_03380, partial [Neolewinella lacunae]|nr:hypothetical protein [Neolewinella lacunae]